jgi:Glycosyl hydrolase family 12/Cellulose binding domain
MSIPLRRVRRAAAVVVAGPALAAACVVTTDTGAGSAGTTEPAITQICQQFGSARVQDGRYVVQNNEWGDNVGQCIDVTSAGFRVTAGAHDKPTNGAPGAYPSIFRGCHYNNCSTGSGLPANVTTVGSLATTARITVPSTGSWNAAYDLWLDPTPRVDGQNTGAEIMVWINHLGPPQPVGSRVATVALDGATWDVWFGNIGWNVISYVRQQTTTSFDTTLRPFVDDALARGRIQSGWFLTSVQFGFEPWVGGPGLAVDSFSVSTIAGETLPPPPPPGSTTTTSRPASTTTTTAASGPVQCRVTVARQSWPGGFVDDVTVANTGTSAISGWVVRFAFPGDAAITNAWNTTASQTGKTVEARNMDYNATIAPGASTAFGFQAAYQSNGADPTAYSVNGSACTVG